MNNEELKRALINKRPVVCHFPNSYELKYDRVSAIIYRVDKKGQLIVSAEVETNNGYSKAVFEPKYIQYWSPDKKILDELVLEFIDYDSWNRSVYKGDDGNLYVDVDPRILTEPQIFTKYKNEFDGEPCDPLPETTKINFNPFRVLWAPGIKESR